MIENWDYNEKNALEIWDIYDKDKTKVGYTKHRSEKLNDFECEVSGTNVVNLMST